MISALDLKPLHVAALRQLAQRHLAYSETAHGWLRGHPSPSDDPRLAFNTSIILWLGFAGLARVDGHTATIATEGIRVLREIDERRAA